MRIFFMQYHFYGFLLLLFMLSTHVMERKPRVTHLNNKQLEKINKRSAQRTLQRQKIFDALQKKPIMVFENEIIHLDVPSYDYGSWWLNDSEVGGKYLLALVDSRIKNQQNVDIPLIKEFAGEYYPVLPPLYYALRKDVYSEITKKLLLHGANPNQMFGKWPALHEAVSEGAVENVKLLLEAGADACAVDTVHNSTALHVVARGSYWPFPNDARYAIMKLLLQYGVDPNTADRDGRTPLFHAVRCEKPEETILIRLLLEHGARTQIFDERGDTPKTLAQAVDNRYDAGVQFIEQWAKPIHLCRFLARGEHSLPDEIWLKIAQLCYVKKVIEKVTKVASSNDN